MTHFRCWSAFRLTVFRRVLFAVAGSGVGALHAQSVTAVADPGALMPAHGTVSTTVAKRWEDGLAAGNGTLGALLYGDPSRDTILVNHSKLWLPSGSYEILPKAGEALAEMRRIIGEKGYGEGQKFFLQKARESGWGGKLIWTDVFHPGFFLNLEQTHTGAVREYARVEDFSKGEVWAQWRTDDGEFSRRLFVLKTDNTIVTTTTGPTGKVSLRVQMQKVDSKLIDPVVTHADGWITSHNVYVKGKGGYDAAIRVLHQGGTRKVEDGAVVITGADSVTLLMRIVAYRTPLPGVAPSVGDPAPAGVAMNAPGPSAATAQSPVPPAPAVAPAPATRSESWITDPANPVFSRRQTVERETVQLAGKVYEPRWMDELKADLERMPADYSALLKPHAALWRSFFDRVSVDLGGAPEERRLSSEAILEKAKREQKLSPALLERMYDAGRYVFMCTAGPETPPNLFGIWSGVWNPRWSGDYTTDTNLQLDTQLAYSANLAEFMGGYFHLWDSFIPDFRKNAAALYGTRGILIGSRHSNNGLALHWDQGWPGNQWTPGAIWIANWYYDYYQYTGDRKFLRDRAIPWMKETALFWEDFLKGTEDANGKFTFRPSFSAENGSGDNTSQDIQMTHQLFTNLIAGCEQLGIEKDGVARWKAMLAKLPPLLINEQGQLKEWSNPKQGEKNNHRHLMHLYGAFESQQFDEEEDPRIFAAARVALANRIKETKEGAIHGYMHTGLAAVGLGQGELAFQRIEKLAQQRAIFLNMVDGHFGGPDLLCVDGNGGTPEIVNRMVLQSKIGRLTFLPAVPPQLPKGTIRGTRARGAITVNTLSWDMDAGTCSVVLTADATQTITLAAPPELDVTALTIGGKKASATRKGLKAFGEPLKLPAGKAVALTFTFTRRP